jgi:hypothetical protein
MNNQDSSRNWNDIIASQPKSGLSIAAYCKSQAISPATFYKQKKLLSQKPVFQEIIPEITGEDYKITFKLNGNKLEFEQSIGFEDLSKVLCALLYD